MSTMDRTRTTRGGQAGFGLVEVLVAVVILAFGLLAVAGVSLMVAGQTRGAAYDTDQAMIAQQVMDVMAQNFDAVPTGTSDTTMSVAGRSYTISADVTQPSVHLKEVQLVVSGRDRVHPDTFQTSLHRPRPLQ